MLSPSLKAKIITLGCAKNEVDSEEIAGILKESGYLVDSASAHPDVIIINTCGFLEASKKESIEEIRKAVRTKGHAKVVVAGCLSQRMGKEMMKVAPGADAYIGVGQMGRFDKILATALTSKEQFFDVTPPQHRWAGVKTRARTGFPWSAYLKLSEGCDHPCTFCSIPSFRGKHVSKPIERILEEARHLVATGAREINLIAQDITQYGYDLYKKFTLPKILRELNQIEGLDWIRLLYFYPSRLNDEVIEAVSTLEKVLPYIDIPLQHSCASALRRMKRPGDGEKYLKLFEKLRTTMPNCAIRTTFIVGFPGETDEEFEDVLHFMEAAQLDRVGAFMFSQEPGTPSFDMPNQIPKKIKQERYNTLMSLQQQISLHKNKLWLEKSLKVLIEAKHQGWLVGRSFRDAPEIDGLVFVDGEAQLGDMIEVKINQAEAYDLYGIEIHADQKKRRFTPLRMTTPKKPL